MAISHRKKEKTLVPPQYGHPDASNEPVAVRQCFASL